MENKNKVFIAASLDGYIADKNGGIEWLHSVPNPDNLDLGYNNFISQIDAIVMGRVTFETVCGFDVDWPYTVPVFILSNSMNEVPEDYNEKAYHVNGSLSEVLNQIHQKGYYRLYIDGGTTIQNFLKEDLIDDMIITTIPILLGGGFPLFSEMQHVLDFELTDSKVYLKDTVQNHFRRNRQVKG